MIFIPLKSIKIEVPAEIIDGRPHIIDKDGKRWPVVEGFALEGHITSEGYVLDRIVLDPEREPVKLCSFKEN